MVACGARACPEPPNITPLLASQWTVRGWQVLASCRHLPNVVGAEVCAHGYPPPTCAPLATECGEGLIGVPDGKLTPAPAGAGPREQGGLRLRMSVSPSPPPPR